MLAGLVVYKDYFLSIGGMWKSSIITFKKIKTKFPFLIDSHLRVQV